MVATDGVTAGVGSAAGITAVGETAGVWVAAEVTAVVDNCRRMRCYYWGESVPPIRRRVRVTTVGELPVHELLLG